MTPTLSFADAVSAAEQAETARAVVVARRNADQSVAENAQQKADAAKAVVTQDLTDEGTATAAEVDALKALLAATSQRIADLTSSTV